MVKARRRCECESLHTYQHNFISRCFDSSRNVLIQQRMTRLENRGVVFLTSYEELRGIHLSDVKYRVNGDLD